MLVKVIQIWYGRIENDKNCYLTNFFNFSVGYNILFKLFLKTFKISLYMEG